MQSNTKEIVKIIGRLYLALNSVYSIRTALAYLAERKFEEVKKLIDDNSEIIETVIRTEARQIEINGEYLVAKSLPTKEFEHYVDEEYNTEMSSLIAEHRDARKQLLKNITSFIENQEG